MRLVAFRKHLLCMYQERRTIVLTIGNYVKAKTPEEAYELNQARSSRIMGGMMWMRLSNARVKTLIDISGLGLDQIEETEDEIRIVNIFMCFRIFLCL